ncbi:MAG: hypothetical protein M1817_001022 [Caeruleum heppii]|nr:MAG: hypothetical protein M1817_001022 [Caeruleum heppii]
MDPATPDEPMELSTDVDYRASTRDIDVDVDLDVEADKDGERDEDFIIEDARSDNPGENPNDRELIFDDAMQDDYRDAQRGEQWLGGNDEELHDAEYDTTSAVQISPEPEAELGDAQVEPETLQSHAKMSESEALQEQQAVQEVIPPVHDHSEPGLTAEVVEPSDELETPSAVENGHGGIFLEGSLDDPLTRSSPVALDHTDEKAADGQPLDASVTGLEQIAGQEDQDYQASDSALDTTEQQVTAAGGIAASAAVPHGHQVVVIYEGSEVYLFPPSNDDASSTFFLSDEALAGASISELLVAIRTVLAASIDEDDELSIFLEELDLTLNEDSHHTTQISLRQLVDLHVQLHRVDGIPDPDPLYMTLTCSPSITRKVKDLANAVAEGKGLSQVMSRGDFVSDDLADDVSEGRDVGNQDAPQDVLQEVSEKAVAVIAAEDPSVDHSAQPEDDEADIGIATAPSTALHDPADAVKGEPRLLEDGQNPETREDTGTRVEINEPLPEHPHGLSNSQRATAEDQNDASKHPSDTGGPSVSINPNGQAQPEEVAPVGAQLDEDLIDYEEADEGVDIEEFGEAEDDGGHAEYDGNYIESGQHDSNPSSTVRGDDTSATREGSPSNHKYVDQSEQALAAEPSDGNLTWDMHDGANQEEHLTIEETGATTESFDHDSLAAGNELLDFGELLTEPDNAEGEVNEGIGNANGENLENDDYWPPNGDFGEEPGIENIEEANEEVQPPAEESGEGPDQSSVLDSEQATVGHEDAQLLSSHTNTSVVPKENVSTAAESLYDELELEGAPQDISSLKRPYSEGVDGISEDTKVQEPKRLRS